MSKRTSSNACEELASLEPPTKNIKLLHNVVSSSLFGLLPEELMKLILSFLDHKFIIYSCSRISRDWYEICCADDGFKFRLDYSVETIKRNDLVQLCACPMMKNLISLNLNNNHLTQRYVAMIGMSEHLINLKELNLELKNSKLKFKALSSLMNSKFSKALHVLTLEGALNVNGDLLTACVENAVKLTGNLLWYHFLAEHLETFGYPAHKDYFLKSAELGYTASQVAYAHLETDTEKKIEWLTRAAEAGDSEAIIDLASLYEEEGKLELSFKWYLKGAEKGIPAALFTVGSCYHHGYGVKLDYEKALHYYLKAEEKGDVDAQCSIGYMYCMGQGVECDANKSVEWSTKAAESGESTSQYNLANKFYFGNGIEQNYEKAYNWFLKSALSNYAASQRMVGCMLSSGQGVEKDIGKAMNWFFKALVQEDNPTEILFGILYYFGLAELEVNIELCQELLGNNMGTEFDERFLKKIPSICSCNQCFSSTFNGFHYSCESASCDFDVCQTCFENGASCQNCGSSRLTKSHTLQYFLPLLKHLNEVPKHPKLVRMIKLLENN